VQDAARRLLTTKVDGMVKKSNVVVVAKVRDEGDASNWNQFVGKSFGECGHRDFGTVFVEM
jgi:hypothetical protein